MAQTKNDRMDKFEALVSGVAEDTVRDSFRKLWETPPKCFTSESLEASRSFIFWPSENDGSKYATLLQNKAMPALAVCYSLHSAKASLGFWKSFILGRGLVALGELFDYNELYARAHALELFLMIAAMEELGWYTEKRLQAAMFEVRISVLLNQRFGETYPGGEMSALRALAFWLSWSRAITPDKKDFKVSRTLLTSLSDWVDQAAERGDLNELELAQTLFDDFSRHDIHDGLDLVCGCLDLEENVLGPDENGAFDLASVETQLESHKLSPPLPVKAKDSELPKDTARDRGNRYFAAGDFRLAIAEYTQALVKEVSQEESAKILSNRAMCHMKIDAAQLAVDDCTRAVQLDASSAKSQYRLAQSLRSIGDLWSAARAARRALELLPADAPQIQRGQTQNLVVAILEEAATAADRREKAETSERRKANLVAKLAKRAQARAFSPKHIPADDEEDVAKELPAEVEHTAEVEQPAAVEENASLVPTKEKISTTAIEVPSTSNQIEINSDEDSDDDHVLARKALLQKNTSPKVPSSRKARDLPSFTLEKLPSPENSIRIKQKKKVIPKKILKIGKKDQVAQVLGLSQS